MKLIYQLSDAGRKHALIASGRDPGAAQSIEVDLAGLTADERRTIVDLAGLQPSFTLAIPQWDRYYSSSKTFTQDAIATDAATLLAAYLAARADAQAAADARRDEYTTSLIATYRAWNSERAPQFPIFREYDGSPLLDELQAAYEAAKARAAELAHNLDEARRRDEEAREDKKRQRQAERAEWITAHGSPRLRKCLAGGYDCQRLYVLERAAIEHPGYVVDFNDAARWKDRRGPSEAALDEAARVGGLVVWLTAEPSSAVADAEAWEEGFAPCEAVLIRGYLGEYDLVRAL